jgi:branched-chain amino acid transport system ATP-binding protein
MSALLELRSVTKRFGGLAAVDDVSFAMRERETLGIIGPNGAGKTTLLNLVSGVYPVTSGQILFQGENITDERSDTACHRGIGRTYQIPQPFRNMTVKDNVLVGCLYGRRQRLSTTAVEAAAMVILDRVGLIGKGERLAKDLTLLELKRLELARALSVEPKLILLDEIGAGLIKQELDELVRLIRDLQASGLSIILIEHVLEFIYELCERVIVLDWGKKVAEDTPREAARDPRVIEVYLGSQTGTSEERRAAMMARAAATGAVASAQPGPDKPQTARPLLRVSDIDVCYGAFQALFGVSLEVWPGEIVALLGANGSGKTTMVQTIGGILRPQRGGVEFAGVRVDQLATDQVVELGIAQCLEGRQIFPELTVLENLEMGAYTKRARAKLKETLAWVGELFPILAERKGQLGQTLSGGQQQMLAIGRALMADPRLLLLDEVSLGLAPTIVDDLYRAIKTINERGVAVLLVEQNVHRSLSIAHRAYILERGRVTLSGSVIEIATNERVAEHYFGL